MAKVRRIFTYQNGRQSFIMPNGYARQVGYHMWAGGGGAGGDSGAFTGGNGSAGTYVTGTFNADPGDKIEVIVGGGGQEGRSLDANKKITSFTISGTNSSGVGPTATYGWVNDPTQAIYPVYNDRWDIRTYDRWNAFMNTWAVSNLPSNRAGEETCFPDIYFPYPGDYTLQVACDNQIVVKFRGKVICNLKDNFSNGPSSFTISVPNAGVYRGGDSGLEYTLTNYANTSGNPAGAALVITRNPESFMGGNVVQTYPGGVSLKNIVWATRLGTTVDMQNRVPICYAPVVNFYEPQSGYDYGGIPDQGLAFISDNSTWTQEELQKLNLNFDRVIPLSYPVTITGVGDVDQVLWSGYYTFKRGQTWNLARYNYIGNPLNNNLLTSPGSSGTPANWTNRQAYNDNASGRSRNKEFAKWQLPVPPADSIYIVGYADGVIYNAPSQRGSNNLTWTVNSTVSQFYAGGAGGKSATNESSKRYNYYGGYGGQIGTNQTSGGGGGGGGSSYLALEKATRSTVPDTSNSRIIANWYNDIRAPIWYNQINNPNGVNLTLGSTASSGTMSGRSPELRSAIFNGTTTSNASCPSLGDLNISGLDAGGFPKPFTIEAWVRATGPGTNPNGYGGEIINKDFEYEIARIPNGRIIFAVDWGQGTNNGYPGGGWIYTNYFLPLNTSALISLVFLGNDATLYVDAEKKWQASVDGFSSSGTGAINQFAVPRYNPKALNYKLFIGSRTALNQNWQGYIGDVRLWPEARTQQQIYNNMFGVQYTTTQVVYQRSRTGIAIAGGGGGGGGAGFKGDGQDGSNEYTIAPQPNPNSIGAGATGQSAFNSGGAGGGGGGGCDGAIAGRAAVDGVGSGGTGGLTGGSQTVVTNIEPTLADFVMVGRGGDGGGGGGGGGAGALLTGQAFLKKYQYIQVGGAGDDKLEGGVSLIWWDEKTFIAAGPGGRGGYINAPWAKNGNGQSGGCDTDNTNTRKYNGSGGGAGTGSTKATASGGAGSSQLVGGNFGMKTTSYQNSGGNSAGSPAYGPGGGGGAGSNGIAGTTLAGGNGGNGRTVALGNTGKSYTLAGGGGGAAGVGRPGPYPGFGQAGGGDGAWGTNELEYIVPGTYTFYIPRNTTSLSMEGVAAGGGGGSSNARGAGGGGSGGFIARTAFPVSFGQKVEITVGKGGTAGGNGGDTVIKFFEAGSSSPSETITLQGGRTGSSSGNNAPGGAGGAPNGRQGENGGLNEAPAWFSGSGASSPYGEGGSNGPVNDRNAKPGNGGRGAGGGGGWGGSYAKPGGLGGDGYVSIAWNGSENQNAQANTGSGGGGGFDGGGGSGGSGLVVIAYAGPPIFSFVVNRRIVPPIESNGYTIHECRQSGELVFQPDAIEGQLYRGSGITPAGTDQTFYVPGVAYGGVGRDSTDVFPVRSASYSDFLNNYGVWNREPASRNFDRTYSVYIAQEASYQFQAAADNGAQVFVDGGIVLNMTPADRENGTYWQRNPLSATKKLTVGMHTFKIAATNLNLNGAFAMTVTRVGTQDIVFDSRNPPVPSGSPTGGNGLIVLEFEGGEGTAKVKVNNAWKQTVGQWVKIDGAWKAITGSATKVNGFWQSLFGAAPISVTVNPNDFGAPPAPGIPTSNPPPTSGGGGGGGCKIICTVLHDLGLLPDNIYEADERFGEMLRVNNPEAYYGYVKWASVVVDWMEGSGPQCMFWIRDPERRARKQRELAIRWAHRIATPWAQHMAYRMGVVDTDSRAGRWIMRTGLAISGLIGRITGAREPSKSVTLGYAMWAVFAVFYLMAGIRGE